MRHSGFLHTTNYGHYYEWLEERHTHSHSSIELQCTYVWVLHRSVSTVLGRERGGGTLLGWATLAWFLPGFAWLDRIVHGDGFHRGFRAWATISSPTGSFYTALRMSSVAV